MATEMKTETGVLEQHFQWFFVRTKAGHRWRIEGDKQRFEHLKGMAVEVNGPFVQGAIVIEGIRQA